MIASRLVPVAFLLFLLACDSPREPEPIPTPTPTTLYGALDGVRIETGAPGVGAAIVVDGRLVFEGVSGDFSRSPGRPLDRNSLFVLQGVTELATASMAFRLVEQGRLRLEDRVSDFLPYVLNAGGISVAMLLDHRSGLRDYNDLNDDLYYPLHDPAHSWTREQVLRALDERNAPGAEQRYSQSDYVVLGGILEAASGRSIAQLFDELVARPAGVAGCAFAYDPARERDIVHGFTPGEKAEPPVDTFPASGRVPTWGWGHVWTDHGLACTASDAARLADALFHGKLVSADSLRLMTTFADEGSYSFGVGERTDRGFALLGHAGLGQGYASAVWYDPARRLTIAALANLDSGNLPSTLYDRIEQAYTRETPP